MTDTMTCLCPTKESLDSVGCGPGQKAGMVDAGYIEPFSKCDKTAELQKVCPKPTNNCIPVGDSNAAYLANPKFSNACNGGGAYASDYQCNINTPGTARSDPAHPSCAGRFADDTLNTLKDLPKGTLSGTIPVSEGTNDPQTLQQCKDNPSNCKLDQIYQAVKDNADDPNNVQLKCLGILKYPEYNQTIQEACARNGGQFVELPGKAGNAHSNDYQQVLKDIGQIEFPGDQTTLGGNSGGDFGRGRDSLNNQSKDLPAKCGIEGTSGNIMYAESGCGVQNWNPKSNVSGPYHFLCSTWNTYAQQCSSRYVDDGNCSNGYRDDTMISTNVMNCMDNNFTQKYGDRCTQAGVSINSCLYAIHVNGEPTFKNMLPILESDPNQSAGSLCGSIIRSDGCSNNFTQSMRNGSLQNLFAEYDRRLGGTGTFVPGPTIAGATPLNNNNQPQIVYVSQPSISSGSNGLGSMFNNPMLGYGLGSSLMSPFQNLFRPANAFPYHRQVAATPPPPAPTLTLTVQPQTLVRGNPITVSWTSSGMSATAPCAVAQNGTTIGQGNAGATTVSTNATSTLSIVVFRLVCQAATNGQVFQQSASVLLQ